MIKPKSNFQKVQDYLDYSLLFLEYIKTNLQAVIVSQNEHNYQFFQYKKDGNFNVSRPINSDIMYDLETLDSVCSEFLKVLETTRKPRILTYREKGIINRTIYTCQQSIGACLDALPSGKANISRKINGDLFERFILLVLQELEIEVSSENTRLSVKDKNVELCSMNYQHDLVVRKDDEIKAIGSIKTSSKDRIDKIFIDKFLYNKLTGNKTPHFAIFLNDVQRKGKEGKYGINTTFLSGHFKGYTIKLNPLDGVYYFDLRPNMKSDGFLKKRIKSFDQFISKDIWKLEKK